MRETEHLPEPRVPGHAGTSETSHEMPSAADGATARSGVLLVGAEGRVRFCGTSLQPLPGWPDDCFGADIDYLLPGLNFRALVSAGYGADPLVWQHAALLSEPRPALATVQALADTPGLYAIELSVSNDGRRLRPPLDRLASSLDRSSDAAFFTDIDGVILYANAAFEEMTGYTRAETIGHTPALLKSGRQTRAFYRAMWDTLRAGNEFRGTLVNRRKDGRLFHEEKAIRPMFDERGAITHFLSTGRDVSRRIRLMKRLVHAATHDVLTRLPNRSLFNDRLALALQQAAATGQRLAVVIVDVDRFKEINDAIGHAAGDAVLRQVAARLRDCVRDSDTVARFGGDEFALLLRDQDGPQSTERILDKILHACAAPVRFDAHDIAMSVSVGASLSPPGGADLGRLIDSADQAMYGVKRAGGRRYEVRVAPPHVEAPRVADVAQ